MYKKYVRGIIFLFMWKLVENPFLKMFFLKWRQVRRTRAQWAGCSCAEKLTELVTRTPVKGPVRVGHIVNGHYQRTEPEPGYHRMTSGPVSCVPLLAFV